VLRVQLREEASLAEGSDSGNGCRNHRPRVHRSRHAVRARHAPHRSVTLSRVAALHGNLNVGLIAPNVPAGTPVTREPLDDWTGAATLDDVVHLVRLSRVLAFSRRKDIHLSSSGR